MHFTVYLCDKVMRWTVVCSGVEFLVGLPCRAVRRVIELHNTWPELGTDDE